MSRILLAILLLLSFQTYAETPECRQGAACVQLSAKSETFIEGLSMLLPQTSTELILGDGAFSSAIEFVASLSNKAAKKLLTSNGVTVLSTPVDAYYDKFEEGNTFLLQYRKDPSSFASLNLFEASLKKYMVILGWALSVLIIASYTIKISKIGLQIKDADKVGNNMLLQLPMYLMLAGLVVPVGASFPIVAKMVITFFIIGAFINSLFVSAALPSFIGLLTSEQVFRAEDVYSNSELLSAFNENFEENVEDLSNSIVIIDLALANTIEAQSEDSTPSDSVFRSKFKRGEYARLNEACVSGRYWHMNILTKNECKGFSHTLGLRGAVLPQKYEGDHYSSIPNYLVNTISTSNEKVRYEKSQLVPLYEDILSEAYRRAALKKELICSSSKNISNSRSYKRSWFCNKFDYTKGQFVSGQYYAEEVLNEIGLLTSAIDVSAAKSKYQTKIIDEYSTSPDTSKSIEAIKSTIKSAVDSYNSEPFVITLYSDNILNGFYSIINGLEYAGNTLEDLGDVSSGAVEVVMKSFRTVLPITVQEVGKNTCGNVNTRRGTCVKKETLNNYDESTKKMLDYFSTLRGESSIAANAQKLITSVMNKTGVFNDSNLFTTIKQNLGYMSTGTVMTLMVSKVLEFIFKDSESVAVNYLAKLGSLAITAIKVLFFVSVSFFVFGIISFFLSFIVLFVGSLYRLIMHIIMIPLYILRFMWEVNDSDSDEDNVLIPDKIKNVLQRVLVEPLAVSASFLGAVLVVIVAYLLGRELFTLYAVMGNGNGFQIFSPSTFAGIMTSFFVKISVSGIILIKGSEFMDYLYRKITEFISDGTSISPIPPNELEQVKEKVFGIFHFRG